MPSCSSDQEHVALSKQLQEDVTTLQQSIQVKTQTNRDTEANITSQATKT